MFFHINAICISLGESKSQAQPAFHSFSGCDTTSAFKGKSEKSIWGAWQAFQDVTDTFVYLATHPFQLLKADSEHFKKLERLLFCMIKPLLSFSSINQIRSEESSNGQTSTDYNYNISVGQFIKPVFGRLAHKHSK
ncbi:hypothetical protein JTB14_034565 [Gonioctena quinquepunctata]|nr:hypothetical protein JTB14_034565 [Gonioctena quinquepunctata]